MNSFIDNKNRTWNLEITVDTVKRVKSLLSVNLLDIIADGGELLNQLANDYELLANIIYVICKPQCDKANVTDIEFGSSLGGNSIDGAYTALTQSLVEFFPQKKREMLQKALNKTNEITTKILDCQMNKMDSPETQAEIEKILAELMGNTSTPSVGK